MSIREKGRKKIKQETSTQYKVTDPISMADLEHIHLRKGRSYPSKPPPLSTKTWEEVRREKEERILKKGKGLKHSFGDYLHGCHGYRRGTGN